jgi:DNA-binding IclR family transcriptional regulator
MAEPEVIDSSQKLFTVLEKVIEKGEAGVSEIARETSIPKSTTHLHLQSLLVAGCVTKRGGRYQPSLQLFEWGEKARNRTELYVVGREEVDKLTAEVQGVAKIGVLEDDIVRLAYVTESMKDNNESSKQVISTEFSADSPGDIDSGSDYRGLLGKEMELHATAIGKAVLAEMTDQRVESVVETHGLVRCTQNTITDRDALYDELTRVRDQGYAIDSGEWVEGLSCIGAAITVDSTPVGAISIAGPGSQMDGDLSDEIARQVINAANIIKVKLTHS